MLTLLIIGAVLVVLGIAGSILPVMPGPIFGFLGLIFLYFGKPGSLSVISLAVFGSAVVLLILIDYLVPVLGAKFSGASKSGLWGAILGSLIGIVYFPPFGIFIGAFFGAVLGEMVSGKDGTRALKAGIGTLVGSVSSIILQTIFSLFLAVYFFIKLFS